MSDDIKRIPGDDLDSLLSSKRDVLYWILDTSDPISVKCDAECKFFCKMNQKFTGCQIKKGHGENFVKSHRMSKYRPMVWLKDGVRQKLQDEPKLKQLEFKFFTEDPKPGKSAPRKLGQSRDKIKEISKK